MVEFQGHQADVSQTLYLFNDWRMRYDLSKHTNKQKSQLLQKNKNKIVGRSGP